LIPNIFWFLGYIYFINKFFCSPIAFINLADGRSIK
jgi:hypothetical protein